MLDACGGIRARVFQGRNPARAKNSMNTAVK
jgi:hypothetical protein